MYRLIAKEHKKRITKGRQLIKESEDPVKTWKEVLGMSTWEITKKLKGNG